MIVCLLWIKILCKVNQLWFGMVVKYRNKHKCANDKVKMPLFYFGGNTGCESVLCISSFKMGLYNVKKSTV